MTGRAARKPPLTHRQLTERNALINALSGLSGRAHHAAANMIMVGAKERLVADIAAIRGQLDSIERQSEAWAEPERSPEVSGG